MTAVHYASSFLDTVTLGGNIFKVLIPVHTALLWIQDRLVSGLCMWCLFFVLTLRLLMSYIYGAPSKARNANVVYI